MLMEGLVGVVALIAAATLPQPRLLRDEHALANVPKYHDRIRQDRRRQSTIWALCEAAHARKSSAAAPAAR